MLKCFSLQRKAKAICPRLPGVLEASGAPLSWSLAKQPYRAGQQWRCAAAEAVAEQEEAVFDRWSTECLVTVQPDSFQFFQKVCLSAWSYSQSEHTNNCDHLPGFMCRFCCVSAYSVRPEHGCCSGPTLVQQVQQQQGFQSQPGLQTE